MEHLKRYLTTPRGTLHVVDDVSLPIRTGETLGVVGESGYGKSTMGRAIPRLHGPISGKVYFEGRGILGCNKKQLEDLKKGMQIISQDPFASLNPRMTVGEAAVGPLLVQGIYEANERATITQRVGKIMNLVGLVKRLMNTYPHELDGGRRQRIGIVRAPAVNPKFIVCDEPMSALDVPIRTQILNLIQDLQEELDLTCMLIIHDSSVVRRFPNDIVVTYLGQIVKSAPAKALFKDSMYPYTEALLLAISVPDPDFKMGRIPLKGEFTSPISPEPGRRSIRHCPYATEGCTSNEMISKEMGSGYFMSCRMVQKQE